MDLVLGDIQARAAEVGLRTPEQFRDAMGAADTRRLLASFLRNLPQAETLSAVDARSQLLNSSREASVQPLDLADRDQTDVAAIYELQLGRASDQPLVLLVRRSDVPDGTLLGQVTGANNAKYPEDYCRKVSTQGGSRQR